MRGWMRLPTGCCAARPERGLRPGDGWASVRELSPICGAGPLNIRTVNIRRDPFGPGVELIVTYGEGGIATKRLSHAELLNLLKNGLRHYADDVDRRDEAREATSKPSL